MRILLGALKTYDEEHHDTDDPHPETEKPDPDRVRFPRQPLRPGQRMVLVELRMMREVQQIDIRALEPDPSMDRRCIASLLAHLNLIDAGVQEAKARNATGLQCVENEPADDWSVGKGCPCWRTSRPGPLAPSDANNTKRPHEHHGAMPVRR